MSGYSGLVLVYARTGVAWRWAGHELAVARHGDRVRVERWQAPCRACGQDFAVTSKLGAKIRSRYLAAIARTPAGQLPDVRIVVPRDQRMPSFELRNCEAHRGWGDPAALV
jgi:hypothetical protein